MTPPRDRDRGTVWSSDHGRTCPGCHQPVTACTCRTGRPAAGGHAPGGDARHDGVIRVSRQSKGRRGKTVTVITGLPLDAAALDALARELKRRCGVGGTVRGDDVEIQGDQRDQVIAALEQRGWTVRRVGG